MRQSLPLRFFNVAAFAVFAFFAWLQWNDVDPAIYDHPSRLDAVIWLLFYLLIGILFLLALARRIPVWILVAAAVLCLLEMGRTAPGLWENLRGAAAFTMTRAGMNSGDPRVELTREFFGAFIALAGVGILAWQRKIGAGGRAAPAGPSQQGQVAD